MEQKVILPEISELTDFIEEYLIVLSEKGRILYINQSACSLYSWQRDEVIGTFLPEKLEQDEWPPLLPNALKSWPVKLPQKIEVTYNTLSNKTVLWQLMAYPLRTHKNGFLLVGQDVTEIRQAEKKIFELDSIIAQAPGNLYWFSKDNIYLGCNEQSAKLLGMTRSEAVGQNFKTLMSRLHAYSDDLVDTLITQGQEVIRTGKPLLNIEEPASAGADNKYKYYLANKVPLRNKKGEVYGVIGISTDITYQKELEKSLRAEREKALVASHAKSEFIANMSHDIRTPITGMLGLIQDMLDMATHTQASLQKNKVNATDLLRDVLTTFYKDGQQLITATDELLRFCNEILEVMNLESGRLTERLESFNIRDLVAHNVHLLTPLADHKKLDLSYVVDADVPRYLNGIRMYFSRILLNILSNALKFTEKGHVKITVKPTTHHDKTSKIGRRVTLSLCVEDTGVGIPENKFETIFEHFARLTPAYAGLYKGSGLGLYTVKRYVDAMNGDIKVESEVGKGSRFIVTLPFTVADHAEQWQTQTPSINPAIYKPVDIKDDMIGERENSGVDETYPRTTVLIVEDNTLVMFAVKLALKRFNCTSEVAETGEQAVSKAQAKRYDLILMDIGLPDFDGIEATKKIRALEDKTKPYVPIVALTGHANNPTQRQAAFDAGMQAVLEKPAQPLMLESIWQQYVIPNIESTASSSEPVPKTEDIFNCLPVIDWEASLRMQRCDLDFVRNLLVTFSKDLQLSEKKLSEAYENKDKIALRAELIRIHGGVCYLKLPQLEVTLKAFYEAIKTRASTKCLKTTYSQLKEAIGAFCEMCAAGE